jgi:hypothetical protein
VDCCSLVTGGVVGAVPLIYMGVLLLLLHLGVVGNSSTMVYHTWDTAFHSTFEGLLLEEVTLFGCVVSTSSFGWLPAHVELVFAFFPLVFSVRSFLGVCGSTVC